MPRLRHTIEQILAKLREAKVALSKREPIYMARLQNPVRPRARSHWKRVSEANQTALRKSDGWRTAIVLGIAV